MALYRARGAVLGEALPLVEKTDERYYEAELYRQRGALLLLREAKGHPAQGSRNQQEAETCFQHALDVARQQQPNPSNSVPP